MSNVNGPLKSYYNHDLGHTVVTVQDGPSGIDSWIIDNMSGVTRYLFIFNALAANIVVNQSNNTIPWAVIPIPANTTTVFDHRLECDTGLSICVSDDYQLVRQAGSGEGPVFVQLWYR